MARKVTFDQHEIWEGLASERLSPPIGILYPIGTEYRSFGGDVHFKISEGATDASWNQTSTGGADLVHISGTNEVDMATVQDYDTIAAGAAVSYDTWDLSIFDEMVVAISGITSNTITILISPDGINFVAVEPINMATRVGAAAVALGNGIYRLELNCQKVRFTSNGTEAKTIAWSAKSTNRMTSVS